MKPKSFASLCLMEHQILQHVKDALRITLGWETSAVGLDRKASSVQFTMQSLARHLHRVMALEEEDGYMTSVRDLKPNLYDRVASLREDHREFRQTMEHLLPMLEKSSTGDAARFDAVCGDLSEFLNRIDRHDRLETELLQTAFFDDIGGEG